MSTIGPQETLNSAAEGSWELIGRDMIRTCRTPHGGAEIVAQFWTSPTQEHARLMVAAPDMLAMLCDCRATFAFAAEEGDTESAAFIAKIDAVLAKALGEVA